MLHPEPLNVGYQNGSEELYNRENDPNEWTNVADDHEFETIKTELRSQLPDVNAISIPRDR